MEQYRQFWDTSFDRLDAHLRRVQQNPGDMTATSEKTAQ
jgi:hypothetical protein